VAVVGVSVRGGVGIVYDKCVVIGSEEAAGMEVGKHDDRKEVGCSAIHSHLHIESAMSVCVPAWLSVPGAWPRVFVGGRYR